ncbi:MAG: radical SAM protein [Candidatus Methanomethylophilaceae archaeon]|nr:radical SAM protein [Candidatus Methanomethylophilaceae archaeon]
MKIIESFRSIQGEGKYIGVPTYFIRSSGCNLRCAWCDTSYAFDGGKDMSLEEIVALTESDYHVSITGGEPMIQPEFLELVDMLLDDGKFITVETNGSIDVSSIAGKENVMISMDVKCPSSKMTDKMILDNIRLLEEKDQVKFVIADEKDLDFAIKTIDQYEPKAEVIFGAVGGLNLKYLAEEVVRRKLNVRVLPQLHKIIWGDEKGV